jgi:hypothetical protein
MRPITEVGKPGARAVSLRADGDDLTESATGNLGFQQRVLDIEPEHESDLQRHTGGCGLPRDLLGLGGCQGERLLDENCNPSVERCHCLIGMQRFRRNDKQRIDLSASQQFRDIPEASKVGLLRLQGSDFLLHWITRRDQFDSWQAGQHRGVQLPKAS